MGDNAKWRSLQCDSGSAIWSHTPPTRSDLRTSQTPSSTKSANAHFQPQDDLVCRRRRCGKHEKWRGMRPSILTIHRTVTTRRADFAVRLTRRDRRAPLMMLVHEECRITCDHRHSLWYLTCSSDCGLSRNAIQQWSVHDFVPMTAAPGNRLGGKRKPERRVPNATFRQLAVTRLNTVRALHPRSVL